MTTAGFFVSGVSQSEKLHETEIHTLHTESELSQEEELENERAFAAVNAQGLCTPCVDRPAQLASHFLEKESQHNRRRRQQEEKHHLPQP